MNPSSYLITADKRSTKEPSLLILNDDCLMEIFQRLDVLDFANLAKTCVRLRYVADIVHVHHFKEIGVYKKYDGLSREEFSDILSVIGIHLLSIEIYYQNDFLLETIRNNCTNLRTLKLVLDTRPPLRLPQLQDFRNLKEVEFGTCWTMCINETRNFFASNPDIETVSYYYKDIDIDQDENFMKSLQLLPKLKSLHVNRKLSKNILQQILHLSGLTKLSFRVKENCNDFLMELAAKLDLVELSIWSNIDDETFDIIKSFRNLENLSVMSDHVYILNKINIFPPKLKCINFGSINMHCNTFLSIVKQLKFLEELQLDYGPTFLHENGSNFGKYLYDKRYDAVYDVM